MIIIQVGNEVFTAFFPEETLLDPNLLSVSTSLKKLDFN